ncbi:Zn-ribbon domain-containing OB-fold protein [[Eubacterium] cellulosolvens]
MGFDEFGLVSFVPFTKVSEFTDYLKNGKLCGKHCKKCNTVYFPPRAECVKCLAPESEMEWLDFSGKGKLLTYTTIHAAPTGFQEKAPYTIGVVDLAEGGRLLAWIEDPPEDESKLKLGLDVLIEPKVIDDGRLIYVVKLC